MDAGQFISTSYHCDWCGRELVYDALKHFHNDIYCRYCGKSEGKTREGFHGKG